MTKILLEIFTSILQVLGLVFLFSAIGLSIKSVISHWKLIKEAKVLSDACEFEKKVRNITDTNWKGIAGRLEILEAKFDLLRLETCEEAQRIKQEIIEEVKDQLFN